MAPRYGKVHHVTSPLPSIEWLTSPSLAPYENALGNMEKRVDAVIDGTAPELVWFLEHPPTITAGTSAVPADLLNASNIPVFNVGRGGQHTWHGPGQRIGYLVLNLNRRRRDVRLYVKALEAWISEALAELGVAAGPRDGRIGLWVDRSADKGRGHEDKIAALGIRIRRWVSFHGVSINVNPDLAEFGRIVPCGIDDPRYGVTSLEDLGIAATMADVDSVLKGSFSRTVGSLLPPEPY